MSNFGTPVVEHGASPERPWLGLRAYTLENASYFYGRDQEIDALFGRVRLEPLTLLFGKSGLGKSSLLGAGLLPRLKVEGWRPLLIRLRFDLAAPPLVAQLRAHLATALQQTDAAVPLWQQAFDSQRRTIIELERPVLIVDQFEEVFTLCEEALDKQDHLLRKDRRAEVAELMGELATVIERRMPAGNADSAHYDWRESALRIVLTLRDDYLHALERWKKLIPALMRNRVELRELRGPEALDVVLEPARKGTRSLVDADVAQAIVCYVADRPPSTPLDEIEAVPPLLSLLCAELNEARLEANALQITQTQLQGEAEKVLERFYDRSFNGMPSGVRRAIEDLLIDNGGRIREASSRDTVLSEMREHGVDEPERWLAALVDGRLLTIEERAGAPRVELTHDLLVPLVARARERRKAEEAQEFAKRESDRAIRTRNRSIVVAVVFAILTGMAFVTGYHAWVNQLEAEQALSQSISLQSKLSQTLHNAAQRSFGASMDAFENGKTQLRLARLAEALRFTATLSPEQARVIVRSAEVAAQSVAPAPLEIHTACLGDWHPVQPWILNCPNTDHVRLIDPIAFEVIWSLPLSGVEEACFDQTGEKFVAWQDGGWSIYNTQGERLASQHHERSRQTIGNGGQEYPPSLLCNRDRHTFQVLDTKAMTLQRVAFDGKKKEVIQVNNNGDGLDLGADGIVLGKRSKGQMNLIAADGKIFQLPQSKPLLTVSSDALRFMLKDGEWVVFRFGATKDDKLSKEDSTELAYCSFRDCFEGSRGSVRIPAPGKDLLYSSSRSPAMQRIPAMKYSKASVSPDGDLVAVSGYGSVNIIKLDKEELMQDLVHTAGEQRFVEGRTAKIELREIISEAESKGWPEEVAKYWVEFPPVEIAAWSLDGARLLTVAYNKAWIWDTQKWTVKAGPYAGLEPPLPSVHGWTLQLTNNDSFEFGNGEPLATHQYQDQNNSSSACFKQKKYEAIRLVDPATSALLEMLEPSVRQKDVSFSRNCEVIAINNARDGFVPILTRKTGIVRHSPDMMAMADLLEWISKTRIGDDGQVHDLHYDELLEHAARLRSFAQMSNNSALVGLVSWHLSDPVARTITPFSSVTVYQQIEREINWVLEQYRSGAHASKIDLDSAYKLHPGHPLILLALSVFETRPETKALWKRLSFPRFEKDARLAARAAEILLIDKDPDNARKAALIALSLPTATSEDKARAQAVLDQIAKPAN